MDLSRLDDQIESLGGTELLSTTIPGVSFRIERMIGMGASALAFFALRVHEGRTTPVVVKVIRPSALLAAAPDAALMVRKEAVALGRLNERVPPTPFVVRVFDVGELGEAGVPWLALEYVHGGFEGTTLSERVRFSVQTVGHAFDAGRAAHAVRCLAEGLTAVAEVGVIHRDLSPRNVLCCGFGESEIFKIADFGLARASGMATTFGSPALGTPGYSAPEQCFSGGVPVGPYTDTFSLGCLTFFILTGEHYFEPRNYAHMIELVRSPRQRRLLDCAETAANLRERPAVAQLLDRVIANATDEDVQRRPSATVLAEEVAGLLGQCDPVARPSFSAVGSPRHRERFRWFVRPGIPGDVAVHSVAWESDGRALVGTEQGLKFWSGTDLQPAGRLTLPGDRVPRIVRRVGPAQFVLGDGGPGLSVFGLQGLSYTTRCEDEGARVIDVSGWPPEFAVAAGVGGDGAVCLWTIAAGRWVGRFVLEGAPFITALTCVERDRWLVVGRREEGGFAVLYTPTRGELEPLPVPPTPALLAAASQPERRLALAVGRDGATMRLDRQGWTHHRVPGSPSLSTCGVDVGGREWAAGTGTIWARDPGAGSSWELAWEDAEFDVPFVGLQAEVGRVIAMSASGAVVEGRAL